MKEAKNVRNNSNINKKIPSENEVELARYKDQLHSLETDDSYQQFEEEREDLSKFYKEKIKNLQFKVDTEKAKSIHFKGSVVSAHQSG